MSSSPAETDSPRVEKTALPDKQFFKIGEAADLVGVKPHVLRYWESEFAGLRPMKTRGAHRMYRRADVELACVIRRLLHEEGYTVPGAKKRVRELVAARNERGESRPQSQAVSGAKVRAVENMDARASRELSLRAELIQVRNELAALLRSLDVPASPVSSGIAEDKTLRATVTAVVQKTALIHSRTR